MLARKIKNVGSRKNIGTFPSLKLNRLVWWESLIERDFLYLLEFDKTVLSYQEQPFRIGYTFEGKRHSYTPDLFVQRSNKQQIVEVKPAKKFLDEGFIKFCRIISAVCEEHGYEFVVVTDGSIRLQPRLNNIKLFWRYARTPIHPQHRLYCQEFFRAISDHRPTTLEDLLLFFSSKGFEKDVIYALLYRSVLFTDLMIPVNETSIVRLLKSK